MEAGPPAAAIARSSRHKNREHYKIEQMVSSKHRPSFQNGTVVFSLNYNPSLKQAAWVLVYERARLSILLVNQQEAAAESIATLPCRPITMVRQVWIVSQSARASQRMDYLLLYWGCRHVRGQGEQTAVAPNMGNAAQGEAGDLHAECPWPQTQSRRVTKGPGLQCMSSDANNKMCQKLGTQNLGSGLQTKCRVRCSASLLFWS